MSSADAALRTLMQVFGARAAAVVDLGTGNAVGLAGDQELGLEAVAPNSGTLVWAAVDLLAGMPPERRFEDLLLTDDSSFHLFRLLTDPAGTPAAAVHLVLDRSRTNLSLARRELRAAGERIGPWSAAAVVTPVLPPAPAPAGELEPGATEAGYPEYPAAEYTEPATEYPEPAEYPQPAAEYEPAPRYEGYSQPAEYVEPRNDYAEAEYSVVGYAEPAPDEPMPEEPPKGGLPRREPNATWPNGRPVDHDPRLAETGAAGMTDAEWAEATPDSSTMERVATGLRRLD